MGAARRRGLWGPVITLGLALALTSVVTSNTPVQANSDSITGICDRTQKVQDAILDLLPDVSACGDVTDSHLSGITGEIIILDNDELTLKDGDFKGLSKLGVLYIHHNGLSALPEDVFDGLSGLRELYLYNNNLTTLPEDLFDGLSNLETLSLSYNGLTMLPEDVFDGLSSLVTLNLDNNSIGRLPDNVFEDLSGLENLNLNSNSLEDVSTGEFNDLTGLKDLRLAGNSLGELPYDVFHSSPDLQTLHLYSAGLNDLPDGLFYGLANLENLVLHSNPGAPFTVAATLEDMESGRVAIKVLEGAPFEMEVALSVEGGTLSATTVTIDGGNHESEKITVSSSSGNEDVTISVLSATFQDGSFDGIQADVGDSLTVSFLGICGRTQEVRDAILALLSGVSDCADVTDVHLAGIGKLVVNFTSATSIKSGDFAGLTSMTWLQLGGSSYIRAVPEDVFDGLANLQRLYLNLNLTALPEDVFDGLTSLQILVLGANQIRALPEDVFDGLTSLTDLRLHNNQLSSLHKDVFDGLSSLENIVLSTNNISELHKDLFDGLDNLDRLILTKNKLSALPNGLFQGLGDLETLYLANNPGAPFTFTAELEQEGDNGVVVKVAEGAPFNMSVTLNFRAGTLSSNLIVSVNGGALECGAITSPISDDDGVTVSMVAAVFLEGTYQGIQTGVGDSLTLLSAQSNTPATGAPTISGTAQVGQTLTASVDGISDADGLTNVSYSYQWLADDTEIDGATSSTYTVQSSDNGKAIKVRVSFSDDAGNEATLTSEATEAVVVGGL